MRFSGATDIGLIRRTNQDTFLIVENEQMALMVVCDGMGGAAAGEVASSMAVQSMKDSFSQNPPDRFDEAGLSAWLYDTIETANSNVYQASLRSDTLSGMGTTLVCAIFTSDTTIVGNVGDSRAYLVDSNNHLTQITDDHSLVNELVKQGKLSLEAAKYHPQRSVLTNVIGVNEPCMIDLFPIHTSYRGILCCSDGVHGMLSDQSLRAILNRRFSPDHKVKEIIRQAKGAGGFDNITVALAWK